MYAIFGLDSYFTLFIIGFGAVITSAVHGATGVAGGFLMAALLAPFIGVHAVVPIITIMLLVSHSARAFLNIKNIDWRAFRLVILPALPFIMLTAYYYNNIPTAAIAMLMGTVIISSIPLRRLGTRFGKAGPKTLGLVGCLYGGLSGATIGPGMLITPFLLGFGLRKEAFVATLASIAFFTNVGRFTLYNVTALYNVSGIFLGLFAGLLTIPGNWLGREVLRKVTNESHLIAVESLSVLGALQFFYLAFKDLGWLT